MPTIEKIRIGTRGSKLARAQARIIGEALQGVHPQLNVELIPIITRGDRTRGTLAGVGGKGLFTVELEAALRSGRTDLAVHSAKDLPSVIPEQLIIAAVPPRADPRDALVSTSGGGIADLPAGATVGTSSLRRRAQLLAVRKDLNVAPIRGNVETRIAKALARVPKADQPSLDAIVLAMAGLDRIHLGSRYREQIRPLALERFIPAAGQGALVVQTLSGNDSIREFVAVLDDSPSSQALGAERAVLRELGASCRSCIAVHVAPVGGEWGARGMVGGGDGVKILRLEVTAPGAAEAGALLLEEFRRHGADRLLQS